MQGTIRWMSVIPDTNEFLYDISERPIDTSKKSVRDTIVNLLCDEWENFGERGDCIVINFKEEE